MFFGAKDREMLRQILKNQGVLMAKIDDLKSAVGDVVKDFTDYSTDVDQKLAALQTAQQGDASDDEIDTLTKELVDLHTAFKPKIAALAAVAGVPAPAPAPVAPVGTTPDPAASTNS